MFNEDFVALYDTAGNAEGGYRERKVAKYLDKPNRPKFRTCQLANLLDRLVETDCVLPR